MASVCRCLGVSPLLLVLLVLAPLRADVAHGASVLEVVTGVTAAFTATPGLKVAGETLINYLNSSSSGVDISGNITILLPTDFMFIKYSFPALTATQTSELLNMHIISGLYTFNDIKTAAGSTQFTTKSSFETLKRALYPGGNVEIRVAKAAQGPRLNSEIQNPINAPDAYLGTSVYIHGIAAVLTPSAFTGGPFQTVL